MAQEKPSIVLPVIALVSIFVCWPLGLILSIVSIAKYAGATGTEARTLSIVAIVVNLAFVPIIGILAAIAIPNFVKFQCRSKQSEAKGNLKALYVAEESFRAETDKYSADMQAIQFTPRGVKIRYQYTVLEATDTSFRAEARALPELRSEIGEDHWVIDQNNNLQNVTNGCN